jgi:acetylornithine deacetylase
MPTKKSLTHSTKILKDLVSFQILGGQSNLEIIDYIMTILLEKGIEYHLVPNKELTKTSLLCRIGPAVDGGVILSGHTDVVPVAGQAWTTKPFNLTKKDDKLYGRGSCDMKGFLACCLASIDVFKKSELKKPVYFAFSYDEEIGCLAGEELAGAVHRIYKEKPTYAIIGEPSMMQPVVGQKGICVLETTVNGSAGHSSRIRGEVSAIHVCARLIQWLENRMDQYAHGNITDHRFNPPHTSIHVGKINGGIAPNVIADKCTFYWDVRVIPGHSVYDVIQEFAEYCRSVEDELRTKFPGFAIHTKEDHPPVPPLGTDNEASVVNLIKKITGNHELQTVAYAAEAGQFSNEGFETVICGPGDIAQAHRADEFIAIDQLEKCLQMMENLAQELNYT